MAIGELHVAKLHRVGGRIIQEPLNAGARGDIPGTAEFDEDFLQALSQRAVALAIRVVTHWHNCTIKIASLRRKGGASGNQAKQQNAEVRFFHVGIVAVVPREAITPNADGMNFMSREQQQRARLRYNSGPIHTCAPATPVALFLQTEFLMSSVDKPSLSYKDAGVDIDAGNALVDRIKDATRQTRRPEVISGLGGFGALCKLPSGYKKPILVSGTDGVGTKLRLAMDFARHDSIGIDLVAMCVNDLVVCGAEPLFFLDYYATGKLDVDTAASVITGIAKGCKLAGCALVGGETAEMPGMYSGSDYDLAGFCVGVVEEDDIIDGNSVRVGDVLIGIASSGPHSNGYSLVRKIIEVSGVDPRNEQVGGVNLADALLEPTRIYVQPLLDLIRECPVHAIAHITGGGLLENIPRVLPSGAIAVLDSKSWELPAVFQWLQDQGNVAQEEMYRTFNCGIGMVVCIPANEKDNALAILRQAGESAQVIGKIAKGENDSPRVIIH